MNQVEFVLRRIRFHLTEDRLIINGVVHSYEEDDIACDRIVATCNNSSVEVEREDVVDAVVKQFYWSAGINIKNEMRMAMRLPEGWETSNGLFLLFYKGEELLCKEKVATKYLKKARRESQYSIDTITWKDGQCTVKGWALAARDVNVCVVRNGEPVDVVIKRNKRADAIADFYEVDQDKEVGFTITFNSGKREGLKLQLDFGDENGVEEISLQKEKGGELNKAQKAVMLAGKTIISLQKNGLGITARKIKKKLAKNNTTDYEKWVKKHDPKPDELKVQRETKFKINPKISIVIPLYKTPKKYLDELIESVQAQTYGNWELCLADASGEDVQGRTEITSLVERYSKKDERIKYIVLKDNAGISKNTNKAIEVATGDFVAFSDHDDTLAPNALFECVKMMNEHPDLDVVYTDEDKIDSAGKKRFEPHFKSDFNMDLLCSNNYICHLFIVRRTIIDKVGMLRPEFDGSQDHDFILRCCETTEEIYHIPKILYHWRCHEASTAANPESKLYCFEAGRKAVEEHYKRCNIPATVEIGASYGWYQSHYEIQGEPMVSIIIPNKDHVDDLDKCIRSIEEKSSYRNFEFVIVENNSCEETFAYYDKICKEYDNIQIVRYEGGFNFSAINNLGAKHAKGDYYLLLNNDTEIINEDCISEMLGYCQREDVGAVGARLYYPDNTIQHAGVVVGLCGIAGHAFSGFRRDNYGYMNKVICIQDCSAVTAACLMTPKSVYEAVGGLEESFEVAFNDIDYCLKVRELGKLVVYNPYAELYHYESKSRGMEDTPEKLDRFRGEIQRFEQRWPEILEKGDPYYNPNLVLDRGDYAVAE